MGDKNKRRKGELALFELTLNNLNVYSITIQKGLKTPNTPKVLPRIQVISDTDVRLKISRFNYYPPIAKDFIKNNKSCHQGQVGLQVTGAFANPIGVAFTKPIFEQLLRTL